MPGGYARHEGLVAGVNPALYKKSRRRLAVTAGPQVERRKRQVEVLALIGTRCDKEA
jgi:hypothetical protein